MKLIDIMKTYSKAVMRENAKLKSIYNQLIRESTNDDTKNYDSLDNIDETNTEIDEFFKASTSNNVDKASTPTDECNDLNSEKTDNITDESIDETNNTGMSTEGIPTEGIPTEDFFNIALGNKKDDSMNENSSDEVIYTLPEFKQKLASGEISLPGISLDEKDTDTDTDTNMDKIEEETILSKEEFLMPVSENDDRQNFFKGISETDDLNEKKSDDSNEKKSDDSNEKKSDNAETIEESNIKIYQRANRRLFS